MKVMAAGKAKNGFGLLIDTARAEPVTIAKHGAPSRWCSRWRSTNASRPAPKVLRTAPAL